MNTQQPKPFRILLIGDICRDIYHYGTVDRISPEAPVPVFKLHHKDELDGMAGNVYRNLATLGCEVHFMHGRKSTKTRLIDIRSKQHIVRIDDDVISKAISFETEIPPMYDAVVVSDYNKGYISYEMLEELSTLYKGPIFVDTKKTDLKRLEGCIVKINAHEHSLINSTCSNMIVTLGAAGARWNNEIFPAPSVEVSDVCGAGDTFLSALTYWYLKSKDMEQSVKFAIKASSVTVQHLGVYAPTLEEIL